MSGMGFQDTIDWYDANAQTYADNLDNIANTKLLDRFSKRIGKEKKILDAGCAAGRDSNLLHARGFDVVGIDISDSLLKIARTKYPHIDFQKGNFLDLPFPDKSFDGVWSHASLVHLETQTDVVQAFREFYRILNNGGIILIFVKQQIGEEKTSVVTDTLSGHDRFFQWFTKDEIEGLLQNVGFQVESIEDNYPDPAGREEVVWIVCFAKK